jgi:hypothetical protein
MCAAQSGRLPTTHGFRTAARPFAHSALQPYWHKETHKIGTQRIGWTSVRASGNGIGNSLIKNFPKTMKSLPVRLFHASLFESASKLFLQGVMEEKTMDQIMANLNQDGVGNIKDQSPQIYGYEDF